MWAKRAVATFAALDAATSEADCFAVLVDYAAAMGAELLSYHHNAPGLPGSPDSYTLMASGFPAEWVRRYTDEALHRIDPITAFAAYQTRPVRWSEVRRRVRLAPQQIAFLDSLDSWLAPGDGMAVPAFGPSGRHGYVGIGRRARWSAWSGGQVRTVQAVCESFHLRFCELRLAGMVQDFALSEREGRILRGMCAGWPDPMIGATVSLRPDALRSAISRILAKMNVLDRPSAVLRATALGLVEEVGAPEG